jgi:SAM-dependent methyltransferase
MSYLQYGCGFNAPEGWHNFDNSPTLRFEQLPILGRVYTRNARRFPRNVQYGDIITGLPVPKNSQCGIFCSHVLEHLTLIDAKTALRNTHGYLRNGGIFRIVVPDLQHLATTYLQNPSPAAAHAFMESSLLGVRQRPSNLREHITHWFGHSKHQWMWDEKALAVELREAGFRDIRRAYYGDAEDRRFIEVEDRGRFEVSLGMQCRK